MAIPHAAPGQAFNVHPLGDALSATKTFALFKSADLEVIRLVLPAGKSFPKHKVAGEVTIHCLEGRFDIALQDTTVQLGAGELLFLSRHQEHAVAAVTDASALVTIALKS